MNHSKKLVLFLYDGTMLGRVKCTLANWTGLAYKIPRTMLEQANDIVELRQTSVYFLVGSNEENGMPVVYIGQASSRKNGEGVLNRIREHNRNPQKDYWTEVIMLTTSNNSLGPTEICYLEHRFCQLAMEAGRYEVKNGNDPNPGNITEESKSEMDDFIYYAKIVLGALGHNFLDPVDSTSSVSATGEKEPLYYMEDKSAKATGKRTADGFVVLKGSTLCAEPTPKCPPSALMARQAYADKINEKLETTADILFKSPSAAACFVAVSSRSGYESWHDENGHRLEKL